MAADWVQYWTVEGSASTVMSGVVWPCLSAMSTREEGRSYWVTYR